MYRIRIGHVYSPFMFILFISSQKERFFFLLELWFNCLNYFERFVFNSTEFFISCTVGQRNFCKMRIFYGKIQNCPWLLWWYVRQAIVDYISEIKSERDLPHIAQSDGKIRLDNQNNFVVYTKRFSKLLLFFAPTFTNLHLESPEFPHHGVWPQ